ncbi:Fc.00g043480.m01.CDS01 [Cosmosporella sp. VM-42]
MSGANIGTIDEAAEHPSQPVPEQVRAFHPSKESRRALTAKSRSSLESIAPTETPGQCFTRLSVDPLIYESHGLYAIDYPSHKYTEYQAEASQRLETKLICLLRDRQRDIVIDLSFWSKEYRDEYKAIVDLNGGRWVLVFLDAEKEVLWRRISERRVRRDALNERRIGSDGDSAFDVDDDVFEIYCNGFESPAGEGEIVIKIL